MPETNRTDIKHRALRAAAKVALLGAGFGCGAAPTTGLQGGAGEQAPQDAGAAQPDIGAAIDAGVVVVGDAGVLDSGLPIDAGADYCDMQSLSSDDYLACCERIGWDWNRGCAAWGPPAPPALEKVSA